MDLFYEERKEKLFIGGMTRYVFPAHVHNMAELVVVTRGYAVVGIDGVQYRLEPGDAGIAFPLIPHSYDALSPDARGITAIFPPDIIPEYEGTFHGLQPESPILKAKDTGPELQMAVSQLEKLQMETSLPLCVAFLHVLLAATLHNLTYRPVTPMRTSPWKARPRPWASALPTCPISFRKKCIPISAILSTPSGSTAPG